LISGYSGVVQFIDIYEDDCTYFLVLELVQGGGLLDKLTCKDMEYSEQRAASLISQVVATTTFLHDKRILHRDIKPENLLFTNNESTTLKLCDFGIAIQIPEGEMLSEIIGSPGYIAPEVEEGQPYSFPADMYSIGVLLYLLLCGYPPFVIGAKERKLIFPEEGIT